MSQERYFECKYCKQVVQGWYAAHEWYNKPCVKGKVHKWVEIAGPEQYHK